MKYLTKVLLTIAVIVIFQFSIVSVYARVNVTDLEALVGENETKVNDFNEKGQIVGYSKVSYEDDAFIWENGIMTDLMPNAYYSEALDINEVGQVVGIYEVNYNDNTQAFLWDKGVIKDLGKFSGDVFEVCINDKGHIVLYTIDDDLNYHIYTNISDGIMKEVKIPLSLELYSDKIFWHEKKLFLNDKDQFVWNSRGNVFLWNKGEVKEICYSGSNSLYMHGQYYVYDFNNSGQIVGLFRTKEDKDHAFLWDNEFIDLDNGSNCSYAVGINDKRQVVGFYIEKDKLNAFLWENGERKALGEAYNISQYNMDSSSATFTKENGDLDIRNYCTSICINNSGNIMWGYKEIKKVDGEEVFFEKNYIIVDGKIKNIEIPKKFNFTFQVGINKKNQIIGYNKYGKAFICEDTLAIELNGSNVVFTDAKPFVDSNSGRTMIPLRFISERLGAEVAWNSGTKTVGIKNDNKGITLKVGDSFALVDGENKKLDAPTVIITGRTYVPLRFVSEILGAKVDWNEETKTVSITAKIIDDKLQKELEDIYIEYEKNYKGNIDEVKKYVSNHHYVTMKNRLLSVGKTEFSNIESSVDVIFKGFKIHRIFKNGPTIGLVYEKPSEDKIIETKTTVFKFIKFVQENDGWKYDLEYNTYSEKDEDGKQPVFSEKDIPLDMPIDGKVITDIQLVKNVEVPRAFISLNDDFGYEVSVSVNNAEPVSSSLELINGGLKKGENTIKIKITPLHPKLVKERFPVIEIYIMDEDYKNGKTIFTTSDMEKTYEITKTFICK